MTVLLPGMTEDDQRVKICSADSQQGLLDSWKSKVCGVYCGCRHASTAVLISCWEFITYACSCLMLYRENERVRVGRKF